jgi:hypothetical protein
MKQVLMKPAKALQRIKRELVRMIRAYRYIIVLDRAFWILFSFER